MSINTYPSLTVTRSIYYPGTKVQFEWHGKIVDGVVDFDYGLCAAGWKPLYSGRKPTDVEVTSEAFADVSPTTKQFPISRQAVWLVPLEIQIAADTLVLTI